jgi:CTP:molybdopterin cytidylyltransferase MocA
VTTLEGDAGARVLLRDSALRVVEVASLDDSIMSDIDEPHDLAALRRLTRSEDT